MGMSNTTTQPEQKNGMALNVKRMTAVHTGMNLIRQGYGLDEIFEIVWHDEHVESSLKQWHQDWNDLH